METLCTNRGNIVHQFPKVRRNVVSQPLKVSAQPHQIYSTNPPILFVHFASPMKITLCCLPFFHVSIGWPSQMCHLILHLLYDIFYAWSVTRSGLWVNSTVSFWLPHPLPLFNSDPLNNCQPPSQTHLEAAKCQLLFFAPFKSPPMESGEKRPFQTQCKCQLLCCHGGIKFLG